MPKPIFLTAACLVISLFPIQAIAQSPAVSAGKLRANAVMNEMQQVEDTWDSAVTRRDQYGLENVMSNQLVDIAATGDVTTRNQDVSKLFVKDAMPASLQQTVVDVRTLGDSLRIVNGTYVMRWLAAAESPPGTPPSIDEKGVFTHVFQLVNGHWLCVNSQRTVVAEQTPATKTKTTTPRAKSNAASPFHIPLIYKGAQPAQTAPANPPSTNN